MRSFKLKKDVIVYAISVNLDQTAHKQTAQCHSQCESQTLVLMASVNSDHTVHMHKLI